MTFTIRDVRTNEKLVDTEYTRYASAVRSFLARKLTEQTAYVADENWREREAARKNLINLELFGLTNIPDHFLHVSVKSTFEEFLVSYTESEIKGSKNKQSPGRKIGRYLTEFFPQVDASAVGHAIIAAVNKLPVEIARTGKDIRAIYEECHATENMNSCMTYTKASQWSSLPAHPVEAYGDSDLQLAYIRNAKGKISARAMIWEGKGWYQRTYGPDAQKLEALLTSAGFKNHSFEGAKLTKIPYTDADRTNRVHFVLPYVDHDRYVILDDDDNIVIQKHEVSGARVTSTDGFVWFQRMVDAVTGERLTNGNASTTLDPRTGNTVHVHADHMAERTIRVAVAGRTYARMNYPEDGVTPNNNWVKVMGTNELVPFYYAEYNFYKSVISGVYMKPEHMIQTDEGRVSMEEFFELFRRCEITGQVRRVDQMHLMAHGAYWSRDAVYSHATGNKRNGYVSKYKYHNKEVAAA